MRTLSKEEQEKISPQDAIRLLKEGNRKTLKIVGQMNSPPTKYSFYHFKLSQLYYHSHLP